MVTSNLAGSGKRARTTRRRLRLRLRKKVSLREKSVDDMPAFFYGPPLPRSRSAYEATVAKTAVMIDFPSRPRRQRRYAGRHP